jgi:hypothetical protein
MNCNLDKKKTPPLLIVWRNDFFNEKECTIPYWKKLIVCFNFDCIMDCRKRLRQEYKNTSTGARCWKRGVVALNSIRCCSSRFLPVFLAQFEPKYFITPNIFVWHWNQISSHVTESFCTNFMCLFAPLNPPPPPNPTLPHSPTALIPVLWIYICMDPHWFGSGSVSLMQIWIHVQDNLPKYTNKLDFQPFKKVFGST